MAVRSGFFNSVNGDRKYDAARFAEYFASFIGNGVFPQPSDGLQVVANNDMTVTVKAGKAWINGYILINDDDYVLQLDPADGVLNRIDRVVARYDVKDREIRIEAKKGTFSSAPEPPALQRDADAYELGLADIYVRAGAVSITQSDITDLRNDKALCGRVDSLIAGDVTSLAARLDEHLAEKASDGSPPHGMEILVKGPPSALSGSIAVFDGTSGKVIKDSGLIAPNSLLPAGYFSSILSGSDGNVTINTNTTLTKQFVAYNNLTINSGCVLTGGYGITIVGVKGTLTLNGTLKAGRGGKGGDGRSTAGVGAGGAGGGVLIVVANRIIGNGIISVAGDDGEDSPGTGGAVNSYSGEAGKLMGLSIGAGQGTNYSNTTTISGGSPDSRIKDLILSGVFPFSITDIGAGGGASGATSGLHPTALSTGSGGGGVIGKGGNSKYKTFADPNNIQSTGACGGGGGYLKLVSFHPIPSITVTAKGGNGGAGLNGIHALGGAGGGGGLVILSAPSSSAIVDVSGGSGGTGAGGNGNPGQAGLAVFV